MIEVFIPYLAKKMGVEADEVSFDDETFRAPGSNMTPTFLEAAEMARQTIGGARFPRSGRPYRSQI